jgi:uncharacterized protein (UPF0333 family)
MKGQASMEYIILFGVSLVVAGILWQISGSNVQDAQWDMQLAYTRNSLDKIVGAADMVYIQGSPAKMYINFDFPDNLNLVYMQDNVITVELRWKGYLRNLSSTTIANLTGHINSAPGRHTVLITAGPVINITESQSS